MLNRLMILLGLLMLGATIQLAPSASVEAQVGAGATLTVLRGTAAVLKADGSPHSPASSGLALAPGDQVATLSGSGALITFFDGSEIELGSDATIVIRELDRQGARANITIESVLGTSVHRVIQFTDPGSTYRIETPTTVAAVRGTEFGHHRSAVGDVSVAVGDGLVEFPNPGHPLGPGERRWVTPRGSVLSGKFQIGTSLFNAVEEDVSSGGGEDSEKDDKDEREQRDRRENK